MNDFGTYLEFDGRPAVRFERHYPYPVERVWRAVTDPAELRHWFPSPDVSYEARAGGEMTLAGDPYAPQESSVEQVLQWDPPHRFSFTWGGDHVHLFVEPDGDGARFVLINVLTAADAAARNGAGWHVCLIELGKSFTGDATTGPHDSEEGNDWKGLYEEYVAAGLPSGAEVPEV